MLRYGLILAAAVVAQANGVVRARGDAAAHLARFHALVGDGPTPEVRHIRRTQNLAGIVLAGRRNGLEIGLINR